MGWQKCSGIRRSYLASNNFIFLTIYSQHHFYYKHLYFLES
ncbi:Uncharacterised protein [Salmonella enterica subsp. houtenae]|nr:Uncharacterised protein [Salmonella enterica subsp. houtenae]